jgi:aminopeptidase N
MNLIKLFLFLYFALCFQSFGQHNSKRASLRNAELYEKQFELIHTKLEVSFDIPKELLFGKEWISLRPYFFKSSELVLDAKGMVIHKVLMGDNALDYTYDGKKLWIDLVRKFDKKDTLDLFIEYTAEPSRVKQGGSAAVTNAKGLYFINAQGLQGDKPTQIWTHGETEASSCWFPTIDSPNQKTTQELSIRVPDKFTTLSNGLLVKQTMHDNFERTDYWVMKQKHSPYFFFLGVGEFSKIKNQFKGKEVNYYVEKGREQVANKIFGKTPEMMAFFSSITGVDYPWEKFSQIVVRDFVSDAMENTTAVVHSDKAYQSEADLIDENIWEPVIAHELFHHWFGNLVTAENWSNISLNESFANYGEYLWLEHEYGYDKAEEHRIKAIEAYKKGDNFMNKLVRFDYDNREEVFDLVSGNKGGAVLHMLKDYLGDDAFFKGLKMYLTENQYDSAEVHQLRMAFEKVSGKELNWFFNQWFYGGGHPEIRVSHDYNLMDKTITLTLRQLGEEFYFPVLIDIYEGGEKRQIELFVDALEKSVTFSYERYPDWIHVDSNHMLLAEFVENRTLNDYKYILKNASHYNDRKMALEELAKHQIDKKIFDLVVSALNDKSYRVQVLALEKIDLSGKYAKTKVIKKIETMAKTAKNNYVKSAAIKVLGRLVYFDYQKFFENSFRHDSNNVKGAALEALYYLDKDSAIKKAKGLPNNVKETIAYPLSVIYIKERDEKELEFVSKYIIQGMYLSNDDATKKIFKSGFEWLATSNNIGAFENITSDMVDKGKQFKKYNFDKQAIELLRQMAKEQDRLINTNKKELLTIINSALEELMNI